MAFSLIGISIWGIYILSIGKIKYSKHLQMIIWGIFVISLALMAYRANPLWDLSQHFSYMAEIQKTNTNLLKLCTEGIVSYEHNRSYWLFNFLCYVAVKINNFHLVPFITVMVDYLIYAFITLDWQRTYRIWKETFFFRSLLASLQCL